MPRSRKSSTHRRSKAKPTTTASGRRLGIHAYASVALPHLAHVIDHNRGICQRLKSRLVRDVRAGRSLLVFGSGHSSIFAFELYHRAGGASFVLPVLADYLLPTAGPSVVRVLERTAGVATPLLNRVAPQPGEMLWLCSQSGINAAVVDLALEAKRQGLYTVAFTSLAHSQAQKSRHPSQKRLFEACDATVDLMGRSGDALLDLDARGETRVGPVSSLSAILLGQSIIASACSELERDGIRCVYTSVNTASGEERNRAIERRAARRDPLLR